MRRPAPRRGGSPRPARPCSARSACDIVIILVVDADQVETVLFGADGVAAAGTRDRVVLLSSTVDPAYVNALASRLAVAALALLDAPVSGGPGKAAAGTMSMMVSGDPAALVRARPVLDRIAGHVFELGPRAGDASTFKIVNNLLAGANLAAARRGPCACAKAAGLDLDACAMSSTQARARAGSSPIASNAR
jgi:3-hydroxyisobutyrate dehydrogenase